MLKSLAAAVLLSLSLEAATVYRIRSDTDGPLGSATMHSKVRVAGDDICITPERRHDDPKMYTTFRSGDGGATFIAIDHDNQTWYPPEGSPFTDFVGACGLTADPKIGKVKWSFTSPENGRYTGKLTYALAESILGGRVDVACTVTIEVLTTGDRPRELWPSQTFVRTRLATLDERMAPDLATIAGFPLRIAVTSSRQFRGGPLTTWRTTHTVDGFSESTDPAAPACERPAHYRKQAPVMVAPGG